MGELSQSLTGCSTLKSGPTPPLGNTVELTLVLWVQVSAFRAMRGRAGLAPLLAVALGDIARAVMESLPWCYGSRRAGLTTSAITQAQIQGFELAHTNIYLTAGTCEKAGPADPKLQDLHDKEHQHNI